MDLIFKDKEYVLEKELNEIDETKATPEEFLKYRRHCNDATKVSCIKFANMTPEHQMFYEDYWPYEMNNDPVEKYHKRSRQEKYEVVLNSFPSCYDHFILAYHLKNTKTILAQLHNLQQTGKSRMKGKNLTPSTSSLIPIDFM